MVNLFAGFRNFNEESKAPGYLNTLKKQEKIPKHLWLGMPFAVGANKHFKVDGQTFKGPMVFYVSEFDSVTVTLKLVRNPMDFDNDDPDDEIDLDTKNHAEQEFTILRSIFEKLLEPDNIQGADFAQASQAIQR